MRKVKIAFWLIVAALIGVVGWQNQGFLLETRRIQANFLVIDHTFRDLPVLVYFLSAFLAGLFISYVSGLSEKFMAKKNIRGLTHELAAEKKKVSELEQTVCSLKRSPSRTEPEITEPQADAAGAAAAEAP